MSSTTGADGIYDLVYAGTAERDRIAARFPNAHIENASDYIHDERFSVELPDGREEYLAFLRESGLGAFSLTVGLQKQIPAAPQEKADG